MSEKLRIKNFGGLRDVTIELKAINIFIGKQASGKSVSAKLFYFFKSVLGEILRGLLEKKSKSLIEQKLRDKFENYFPPESWPSGAFTIRYEFGNEFIEVSRPARKLSIEFGQGIKDHYKVCRSLINQDHRDSTRPERLANNLPTYDFHKKYYEYIENVFDPILKNNQIFVPAGRSFFTSLQSGIFSLLANNKSIDPFILEFGSFYESFSPTVIRDFNRTHRASNAPFFSKSVRSLIEEIIGAKIHREDDKVYLVHGDGRKVQLPFTSSGQQETLPLSLMLAFFSRTRFIGDGSTVYIEEPEAHLFPTAQKKMVELISTVFNESITHLQFVITTHSPYILTSFNNLLHAGFLSQRGADPKKLNRIISKSEHIRPSELNAVAMQKGSVVNLVEKKSGLISADILDKVSEDITVEFDKLLSI